MFVFEVKKITLINLDKLKQTLQNWSKDIKLKKLMFKVKEVTLMTL